MNAKRELPPKESGIFKNILKNYETRQYKKGLKLADTILKKFPEHGETLAMKGLFVNNLGKKEEGYDYVKKGLRYDLTSHICWHVYGLLHRADKNYEEAAKCYTHALKYNKNDIHILRDFALLQTQMRHYDALIETRTQLLQQKPTNPPFWIGLAVAYQLAGKPDTAAEVLKAHEDSLKDMPSNYEHSELLMYHNTLIEETGDYAAALKHLDAVEAKVTDSRGVQEKRALYLSKLGKQAEAEAEYRKLISENPHDRGYTKSLLALRNLDEESKRAEAYAFLTELAAEYPRSKAIEDLVLTYATGEAFTTRAAAVIQHALRKGVPSIFINLKKHYTDAEKKAAIEKLVLGYRESLEKDGTFGSGNKEIPTVLLWTYYFIAQHYDYVGDQETALKYIDRAIEHTPTVVELYMTKGRIYKHKGDLQRAAAIVNDARELDLQDRFINSKCAKYMLRAGDIERAEQLMGLFTRKEVAPVQDLIDMQCQWFITEEAFAYLKKKDYGRALKKFHTIEKFYVDIFDDQFDFHTYCLRKMTLRSYVDMLRFEDHLRQHPYYMRAAQGAVEAYTALADKLKAVAAEEAAMSEVERQKARAKARKAAQKEAERREQEAQAAKKNNKDPKKPVDQDPYGTKYAQTTTPLEDALQFVKPLQSLAPNNPTTHRLGFEIYVRQSQWLLALRCLVKLRQLDADTTELVARFKKDVAAAGTLDPVVQKAIDAQLANF
ncbi:NMDA receptor-regulated protein 1-domain-containing protein [Syncephalastrum racemosum]|uniref:NMDA receptor-regulated protein 1-domain-containing protein n=1 Tax=Syncephalastrum racemosum TaxID=13706 RepID=A0A1X2HPT1_SYNRA|nr:NMDA receptor-regulated protein 1-domain-containing protein [Syncephalastrum racemosum]